MLRVSAQTTGTEIDILAVNGDLDAAGRGIEFGPELMGFAESVATRSEADLKLARNQLLIAAGESVLVDAAGVAANFQRMVRIADSMGIPIDNMETEVGIEVRQALALSRFASAQNTVSG